MSDNLSNEDLDPSQYEPVGRQQTPLVFTLLKIFIGISALMLCALGVLYAMGGGEKKFVVSQEIEAEREQVYQLITEPESVKKWVSGVTKIEPVGEIQGSTLGAKSEITVDDGKVVFVMTDEVVAARKNQEIEFKMDAPMFDASNRFEVNFKDGDGLNSTAVVVTQTFKVKFKGGSRILAPFIDAAIEKQLKDDLQKLKKLAEDGEIGE